MQNRILMAGVVVMVVAVLFLLAGAIPVDHGTQVVIFQTPAFLTVSLLGGVFLLIACFRRRRPFRQVAFVLSHGGLVLLMAGEFMDWRGEKRIDGVRLPVAMGHAVGRLRDRTGNAVDLGFTLAVQKFSVNYYDPVYSLNIAQN
jgi:peptidoglycan/LPS O-acetylase OafA/YrhL